MRLSGPVLSLGHGDHACFIYDTFQEQVAALAPFIRAGIEGGERCVCVCDDRSVAEIRDGLREEGVGVDAAVERGSLIFLTRHDAYLAAGEFDPHAMVRRLAELEAEALAEGFAALRITGEMTWALGPEAGCERLMEYESLVNRHFPGSRSLALCQYSRSRFPAELIEQALQTHPVAVLGGRAMANAYYEAPGVFRTSAAARVDWRLRQIEQAHESEERSRRSQALIAAQKRSLELVVSGAPLGQVLHHLVSTVEEQAGGTVVASILLLDPAGRLRSAASPGLPDDYLRAIDGLPADPELGTCCAAAALGEVVVTPDFAAAPGWRGLSHLPLVLGLRGAWSMPILARDGGVLGTFGTYFRECRPPSDVEREVVGVLARTASVAIERVRAEEALRERQEELRRARDEAETASQAKSQFLAVMSHELRTPLTGIIGYADLLGSDVWGPTTEQQRTQIARVKASAWHLVSIIDEILTFSRVEAGREAVSVEAVDFAQLLWDCAELLRPQAEAKKVDLRVAGAGGPLELRTDKGKTRQIVLNLVANAIKFTDVGSVELAAGAVGGGVELRVRDTLRVERHTRDRNEPCARHRFIVT